MTIFLCGFMGCGKTTAGKLAAKKLGSGFTDTDDLIVRTLGMSIPDIFEKKGEPFFRQTEAEIVKSLCGKTIVAACGGGAMLNPDTAKAAREAGAEIVFLDVPFETCYERISGDTNRPIVMRSTKEELKALYDQRREVYLSHSTVRVECDGSPVENAEKIAQAVRK
ncbi:MAG: Shikimate kinase [Firmicutes bacterium ADurb.BinA205]|nr:MAG: Shikimate kinase [Firmicutes bacterium ADurb.BinA205]HOC33478.1 shikimate kinase [Ruminococcus flavefaciens]HQL99426.1 shikimate kinase [Ruminococcus flavefaciens]